MQNSAVQRTISHRRYSIQWSIWAAYASAVAATIGLIFLAIFFSGVPVFGPMNDIAVIIQYTLLLHIMTVVWRMIRPYGGRLNDIALLIGLGGSIAVIILQTLLVLGMIPFEKQIRMVVPAFLVAALWFVLTGRLGRTDDRIPQGTGLHILAGLVVGYPLWAVRLARKLQSQAKGEE